MLEAFPIIDDLERRPGSLVRGLGATARPTSGPPPAFCSFPEGLSELVRGLLSRMPAPSLRCGCPVRSLARAAGGFALGLEDGTRITAGAVVVALPTSKAAPLIASVAPEAARGLGAIPCASSATVLLGYRRGDVAHPLDGHGLFVPRSEGLRTVACSFSSTKFPGCAPEGHVLLRGLVGGARDSGVLALGDGALVETVRRELGPALGLAGSPVIARVFRWPAASPQMEVGHFERVAEVERHLAAVPRLFLAGGGFRAGGVPESIGDGLRTAAGAAERVSPVPG
jgi:oxygen-dependent protoporphyrinogen oxidase